MERLNEIIQQCVRNSAEILNELYTKGKSDLTSLVIPNYRREGYLRLSEQELRFVFCSQLEKILQDEPKKGNRIHYCVEEPTKDIYKFSEKGSLLKDPKKGEGQSANFDLTIEDEACKALIEFKAKKATPFSYKKDLSTLWNPKDDIENKQTSRFFINIFEKTSSDKVKFKNYIENKLGDFQKQEKKKIVEVIGIFLHDGKVDIISI